MKLLLKRMLNETEFLSDYGVRALSKVYDSDPYEFDVDGNPYTVQYAPAESTSGLFGGNSNWRGPIWAPVNYLIISSLLKFYDYYSDDFKVEFPIGSGVEETTIQQIAKELASRLSKIFLKDQNGVRPVHALYPKHAQDPNFKDLILFYEYFDGNNGRGAGASHQTGWTGLIAELL